MTTYKIVRFYYAKDKDSEIKQHGLTLKQAQAYCRRPDTLKKGEWFDGYDKD